MGERTGTSPCRAVAATLAAAPPPANAQAEVWSSTLAVGEHSIVEGVVAFRGYRSDPSFGSLAGDDFDLLGTSFTVSALSIVGPATGNLLRLALDTDPGTHASFLTLHLGSASFPLADADLDTVRARLTFQAPDPVPCSGVDNCFEVPASWELVPSGLTAGSSFRLLLLTSATRDATSSDIADYNTFVQGSAAAGHLHIQPCKSRFKALGGTGAPTPATTRRRPAPALTRASRSTGSAATRRPATTRTSATGAGTRATSGTSPAP